MKAWCDDIQNGKFLRKSELQIGFPEENWANSDSLDNPCLLQTFAFYLSFTREKSNHFYRSFVEIESTSPGAALLLTEDGAGAVQLPRALRLGGEEVVRGGEQILYCPLLL